MSRLACQLFNCGTSTEYETISAFPPPREGVTPSREKRHRKLHRHQVSNGAVAKTLAGRDSEAKAAMARLRELARDAVAGVQPWLPFRRPADLARLEDGLRRAALPE
jgi:hypothetical protein